MEYKLLSGSGVTVSRLCLGTMEFGGRVPDDESIRMIEFALDHGVNFFDTANVYMDGNSERVIGKALKGKRDSVLLATKVGHTRHPEILNSKGASRLAILREVEGSLKRLQTDYIDFYYIHEPDYDTPLEETVEALGDLVKAGKIRYWGVSNYAAWQITEMIWIAKALGTAGPILSETVYNLLCRSAEPELVPCLTDHKIGMTVFNPLAGGLLTGKYSIEDLPNEGRFRMNNADYRDRYWNQTSFHGIELLKEIAKQEGVTLIDLSLKWLSQHSFVDAVIIGASSFRHLEENFKSFDSRRISPEAMDACDEVWTELSGNRFKYNR